MRPAHLLIFRYAKRSILARPKQAQHFIIGMRQGVASINQEGAAT
jgi:hypothetical protein